MKDEWEDGIPLTSGRSGLASAVIYTPSCHQTYSQDCIANLSSSREYDDDKKPPDHADDDADITSPGTGPSYHLNCSSNFFSGQSGGQFNDEEVVIKDCPELRERLSSDMYNMMTEMNVRLNEHCSTNETSIERKLQLQQELSDNHVVRLAKFHMKCNKHASCPLQTLKRRFRHFIFKNKKPGDQLGKPKGS